MKLFLSIIMIILVVLAPRPSAGASIERVKLTTSNAMFIDTEITNSSVYILTLAMIGRRATVPMNEPIYVVIISPGGQLSAAKILHHNLSSIPNTILICKYCASAAGMIFAASPHKRFAIKKSEFIMHEPFQMHVTKRDLLNPFFVQDLIDESDDFNSKLAQILEISQIDYEKKIARTDWILTGEELVKHHLADKLVQVECDESLRVLMPETCS